MMIHCTMSVMKNKLNRKTGIVMMNQVVVLCKMKWSYLLLKPLLNLHQPVTSVAVEKVKGSDHVQITS